MTGSPTFRLSATNSASRRKDSSMPWKAAAKQGSSSGFSVRGVLHTCRPTASTILEASSWNILCAAINWPCQLCVVLPAHLPAPHLLGSADLLKPIQVDILSIEIDDMLFPGLPACDCGLRLQCRQLNTAQDSLCASCGACKQKETASAKLF